MRLSMTDIDAAMLQRELEIRHQMRTRYQSAASAAGIPVSGRFAGLRRAFVARLARQRPVEPVERLNPRPQPAA